MEVICPEKQGVIGEREVLKGVLGVLLADRDDFGLGFEKSFLEA